MLNVYENQNMIRGEDLTFRFRKKDYLIVGVADGHGGKQVSELCQQRTPDLFSNELNKNDNIEEILKSLFRSLHKEAQSVTNCSGSTLTVVVINEKTMQYTCANVGDSEALIISPASYMWITNSHRLQVNSSERQKLQNHISFACIPNTSIRAGPPRLYPGGLACSRSIGDADCPHVSCEPYIYSDTFKEEDTILICSDGVWDFASFPKILKLIRDSYNPEFICRLAAKNYGSDDATALILTKQKQKNSIHTGLFRFFQRYGSNSSLSSDD